MNESVEIAKEKFSTFLGFFKSYIKKPLNILENAEDEFVNGIISIIFNLFILSLTVSLIGKSFIGTFAGYSVFSNLIKLFILLGINTGLIGALVFLINRFLGAKKNFKEFIVIYGAYILPVIIVSMLALLLSLINSNGAAITLILLAIGLAIFVIPQYLVVILLSRNKSSIDPFYGQLIYFIGAFIIYLILAAITVDSVLGDILNSISYYF